MIDGEKAEPRINGIACLEMCIAVVDGVEVPKTEGD